MSNADKTQNRRRDSGSSFEFGSLWFAFRRRWFVILFLGASLGTGAYFAVWRYLPPPKASANVIFEISVDAPAILARLPDDREFTSFKQFQSNLITKRSVLAAVLNDPGVAAIKECATAKDPFRWLEETLKIDFKMGREYMRVTAELKSADDVMALIRAVQKNYMYEAVNKEKERKSSQLTSVQTQHQLKEADLNRELTKLRELGQSGGAATDKIAALQQELIQASLNRINTERLDLSSQIRRFRIELASRTVDAAKAGKNDPPEHMVKAEIEANPDLRAERTRLTDLERQLKVYQDTLQPGTVTQGLINHQQAVAQQKTVVEDLPKRLRPAAVEAARAKQFITTNSDKESLESRLAVAESLEKKLEADAKLLGENVKTLTTTQHDFEKSRSTIQQLQQLTSTLQASVNKMSIEIDAPDRVTVFQDPTVVLPDDGARRFRFALIAALGGFVVGAAPVWIVTLRRRVFHDEAQLVEAVPIPLMGVIPHIPRRGRSQARTAITAQPRMRAMVTESIDSTRATVLFKLQESGGRAVMITSSVAGEAKSSVSGHIAISLARAGFRTLIIDSDMRRPTLHRVFGVKKGPGFSDVLLDRAGLDEATQSCQLQNLYILAAGEWVPSASASLAGGAWQDLIKEAKELFDIVVVDSPPVLLVADALTMARDVDAILLSALKDVSEIDLINRSVRKLESLGVMPMGLIASGMTSHMYTPRYYDRYASAYSAYSQRTRN